MIRRMGVIIDSPRRARGAAASRNPRDLAYLANSRARAVNSRLFADSSAYCGRPRRLSRATEEGVKKNRGPWSVVREDSKDRAVHSEDLPGRGWTLILSR